MITMSMIGKGKVVANLNWLDKKLFDSMLVQVNRSLSAISSIAQAMAPVRTGVLRGGAGGKGGIRRFPAQKARSGRFFGSVRSLSDYAAWVEFGAGRGRSRKKAGRRRWRIAEKVGSINRAVKMGWLAKYKRPYLGPAFVQERPKFLQRIRYTIEEAGAQAEKRVNIGGTQVTV